MATVSTDLGTPPIAVWRNYEFIGEFNTIRDINETLGCDVGNIPLGYTYKRSHPNKLFLSYDFSGEDAKFLDNKGRFAQGKPTEIWKDGKLLCTFASITAASYAIGAEVATFTNYAKAGNTLPNGYIAKILPKKEGTKGSVCSSRVGNKISEPRDKDAVATPAPGEIAPLDEDCSPRFRPPLYWSEQLSGEKANQRLVSMMEREIQEAGWLVVCPYGDGFLRHLECIIRDATHCIGLFKPSIMFKTYMGVKLSVAEYAYSWRIFNAVQGKDPQDIIECMRGLYNIREALNFCRFETFTPIGPKVPFSPTPPNRILWSKEKPSPEWVRNENIRLINAAKEWVESGCNFDEMKEQCEKWDKEDLEKSKRLCEDGYDA